MSLTVLGLILTSLVELSSQHGMMIAPPMRSSLWRHGYDSPINYDDNGLYCGGLQAFIKAGGRCGVCGDGFLDKRDHEAGGKFAKGIIVQSLPAGAREMQTEIKITSFHKGYFEFRICAHNNVNNPVSQACLDENVMVIKEGTQDSNFTRYYPVNPGTREKKSRIYKLTLALPRGMICRQCVLQWTYKTGNSWGTDKNGTSCMGCGLQEEFRNCADISIGYEASTPMPQTSSNPTPKQDIKSTKTHSSQKPTQPTHGPNQQTQNKNQQNKVNGRRDILHPILHKKLKEIIKRLPQISSKTLELLKKVHAIYAKTLNPRQQMITIASTQGPILQNKKITSASTQGPILQHQKMTTASTQGTILKNQKITSAPTQGPILQHKKITSASTQGPILQHKKKTVQTQSPLRHPTVSATVSSFTTSFSYRSPSNKFSFKSRDSSTKKVSSYSSQQMFKPVSLSQGYVAHRPTTMPVLQNVMANTLKSRRKIKTIKEVQHPPPKPAPNMGTLKMSEPTLSPYTLTVTSPKASDIQMKNSKVRDIINRALVATTKMPSLQHSQVDPYDITQWDATFISSLSGKSKSYYEKLNNFHLTLSSLSSNPDKVFSNKKYKKYKKRKNGKTRLMKKLRKNVDRYRKRLIKAVKRMLKKKL